MAVDINRGTRRAFLGAGLGAAAALAMQALGRPAAVQANENGEPVKLGATNSCSTNGTTISNLVSADAEFAAGKTGLWGASPAKDGFGAQGYVSGNSGTGVRGFTSGHYSQIAVHADTTQGNGEGIGVRAQTKNGTAVYASAVGGYALLCEGRAVFDRSGRITFPAGTASRTISGPSLIPSSLVLATIQGDAAGTWVRGVVTDPANGRFTIRLNRPAP